MAELNTEQKLRINLSSNARDVIQNDREMFAPTFTFGGFLNELIERCAPVLDASIAEALERKRDKITAILEKRSFQEKTILKVTEALLEDYEGELTEKAASWPKGETCTFRLNNRNAEALYSEDWQDLIFYNDKPTSYIKALVEEYASHSLYEREAIFFHEWVTLVETAVETKTLVRLTMLNAIEEKLEWDVRVYGILPNDGNLFHYIVGKSVKKGGLKSDESIASFRLSRIREVKLLSSKHARSGALARHEIREIEDKIEKERIQFLVGSRKECVVELTEQGRRTFQRTQYMKPVLSGIDEEGRYHFECSPTQIFQYFYKFGDRALVIEPESVRHRLCEEYRRAYEKYQDEADGDDESKSESKRDGSF